jgi:SM-20-related protein
MNQSEVLATLADSLVERGYCILDDAIPADLLIKLVEQSRALDSDDLELAGIGRDDLQQTNPQVRKNQIAWITSGEDDVSTAFHDWLATIQTYLNRTLFMGLFDVEAHYARYRVGDFYKRHVDAFVGQSNRKLSVVFYLNDEWTAEDGGELWVYADEMAKEPFERVLPIRGRLIAFLSERFPHEVRPSHKTRHSIAAWFRVNGSVMGAIDPPQ